MYLITHLCIYVILMLIEYNHSLISIHGVHVTFFKADLWKCRHASSDAYPGLTPNTVKLLRLGTVKPQIKPSQFSSQKRGVSRYNGARPLLHPDNHDGQT